MSGFQLSPVFTWLILISPARLSKWRAREREDADDLAFPDEIDTPQDTPAHTRFARYRGLRSFRTSPWDPYENLPPDYARTFQFEDYPRTERTVRKYEDEHAIKPGTRVTVCVENVPQHVLRAYKPGHSLVLFTLLQHEHKVSVLNFSVQRNTEYSGSVRSKVSYSTAREYVDLHKFLGPLDSMRWTTPLPDEPHL